MVDPNETGKTILSQAFISNPPEGIELFNPLRNYPRTKYDEDIEKKLLKVIVHFQETTTEGITENLVTVIQIKYETAASL